MAAEEDGELGTANRDERHLEQEIWTTGFRHSWRKMGRQRKTELD